MIIKKMIWLALLVCGTVLQDAAAEGVYVVADTGQANLKAACNGIPAWITDCTTQSRGYSLTGGHVFSPIWSAELGYAYYGSGGAGKTPYATSIEWAARGYQLAAGMNFPVGGDVSLVGKIGIAYTTLRLSGSASANADTYTPMFGMGIQTKLDRTFSVRAMYEDIGLIGDDMTGTTRLTNISVGLIFHF